MGSFFISKMDLQRLLCLLNQLLGHLAADVTCLSGSQITVVTLLQIHTDLAGNFELHLIKTCFRIALNILIHFISPPFKVYAFIFGEMKQKIQENIVN